MNLAEFRKNFPQYDDMPDEQLVKSLHSKHYSDMPEDVFYKQIGYEPAEKSLIEKGANIATPWWMRAALNANTSNKTKDDISRMYANVPQSGANLAKGVYEAVTNPIDTAKSVQSLGQGLFEKAFVPNEINGVDFGQTENEQTVDAVVGNIKNRYGSLDAARNTAINDPVGMLLDMSVVPTLGQSAYATGLKAGSTIIPKSLPVSMTEKAARFRPGVNKYNLNNKREIAETITRNKVDITSPKGLDQSYSRIAELNNQIDTMIRSVPKGETIPKAEVLKYVQNVKDQYTGVILKGKKNRKTIEKVLDDFEENLNTIGKKDFTPDEVQKFKKDIYSDLDTAYQKSDFSTAEMELQKEIARGAKESLEKRVPGIKETNAELAKQYQMMEELPSIVGKTENLRSIGQDLANNTVAGSVLGASLGSLAGPGGTSIGAAAGATLGAGKGLLSHSRVRAKNAILLEKLRTSGGYTDGLLRANALPLSMQGLLYSGQID